MNGPRLVGQIKADLHLNKEAARQVAYFADLAEAGKTFAVAVRLAGLNVGPARHYAQSLGLTFAQPDTGDG